jgi:CBS domain-containing protein
LTIAADSIYYLCKDIKNPLHKIPIKRRVRKMIRAKYIMCTKAAVTKTTPGKEVVFKLMATGCPGLPVVNDASEVVGVVTMCDILKAANQEGAAMNDITAEEVMSGLTVTADPDTSVEALSKMMVEHNYSVVPIVKNKKLLGIVSGREIVDTYVEPHLYSVFEE